MPGFLENVNVTIDNSNTSWEIVLDESEKKDVRQLPHMVTVQCSFKPIMGILPRKQDYANQFVPLIVNGDHYLDPTLSIESNTTSDALLKAEQKTPIKDPNTALLDQFQT
jgi:hypothetical protein